MAVAATVRALMGEHSITQAEIAVKIGKTQGYVSPRVNGKKPFDVDELDTIAAMAGMQGVELLREAARRIALVGAAPHASTREELPDLGEVPRRKSEVGLVAHVGEDQGTEDDDRGTAR